MPHLQIDLFPGRTQDQKNQLAQAITQAFVDTLGSDPRSVTMVFREVAPSDWFAAGQPLPGLAPSPKPAE